VCHTRLKLCELRLWVVKRGGSRDVASEMANSTVVLEIWHETSRKSTLEQFELCGARWGYGLLPKDRKQGGIVAELSVREKYDPCHCKRAKAGVADFNGRSATFG